MARLLGVLVAFALLIPASPAAAQTRFPKRFLWGTAVAGFQVDAGGTPSNVDTQSDWYRFTTDPGLIRDGVVSGDRVAQGPGFWRTWRADLDRARDDLHTNAIRLGLEWSRIFPRSTRGARTLRQLDRFADRRAVRHYRRVLAYAKRRGLTVMLTLNHFTLPLWIHEPLGVRRAFAGRGADDEPPAGLKRAGWLDAKTVGEFGKYARYAAWKLGDVVPLWATLNEPLVVASQGFASIPGVTGVKAPAVLSYPATIDAVVNQGLANAAAYDAIHAQRPKARVGFVLNMVDWRPDDPASPADVTAARHADQIFNRAFLDLAVHGWYDENANGVRDPGEVRSRLANRADFIGVNHYSPARAQALGGSVSTHVPLFDFVPKIAFRGTANPAGTACPTTCTDFGWEIDPSGLRNVVREAASYGKPLYVTENGIDDADDDQRPAYLEGYLTALHQALDEGIDVRGYFHWSLLDNFEWAEGYKAKFGLYAFDPRTLKRTARPSARLFASIARTGVVP